MTYQLTEFDLEVNPNAPTPQEKLDTIKTIQRMHRRVHNTHNRNCDTKINDCDCFLAQSWKKYIRMEMSIFIDFNISEDKHHYHK